MSLGDGVSIAIIARMNSSRLPGKCLLPLVNKECSLGIVIESALLLVPIEQVHVLTTVDSSDDPIDSFCDERNINCFRGHPTYVLDRLHDYFLDYDAQTIIYWGADCPLMDKSLVSEAYGLFVQNKFQYLSNYDPPTYPEGYDINVISKECLMGCYTSALTPSQRINPFLHALLNPKKWKLGNIENQQNLSKHHWSLDFPEDLEFVQMALKSLRSFDLRPSIENMTFILENDNRLKELDSNLQRPIQTNGFLNSPNVLKEIETDIRFLKTERLISDKQTKQNIDNEISKLQTLMEI